MYPGNALYVVIQRVQKHQESHSTQLSDHDKTIRELISISSQLYDKGPQM